MKTSLIASALLALSSLAAAQTAPSTGVTLRSPNTPALQETRTVTVTRPERPMLWGGLASEIIVPGLSLGVSMPLKTDSQMNMALRGSVEAFVLPFETASGSSTPLPVPVVFNADLLFSTASSDVKVYGGPSVGTLLGQVWAVGGVVGVRNNFGSSNLGWYAEGKAQYLFGGGTGLLIPGARLGVTYRF